MNEGCNRSLLRVLTPDNENSHAQTRPQVADDSDVMVIDSRCGENFAALAPGVGGGGSPAIAPRFDACASWWTQVRRCWMSDVG